MREINTALIKETIKELFLTTSYTIEDKVLIQLKKARDNEISETAKYVLNQIIENDIIANDEKIPMCQDTGTAVIFLEIGNEIILTGQFINNAINEGVREAYLEGYLRKSIVDDPLFNRINTNDNTPSVIYYDFIEGDFLNITVAAKGFGSENMSQIKMMKPADGVEGVKEFVINCVKEAGPNPCPPIVVGVGIGGTFDKAAQISKLALTRSIGENNSNPLYRELEIELFDEINKLNIGPGGLKGKTTCLGVHINYFPTHIAGLPVAVNISCHAYRHASKML